MNNNEQRRESRLNNRETVFVELAAASADGTAEEEILVCTSLDLSANGLQIAVNHRWRSIAFSILPYSLTNCLTQSTWSQRLSGYCKLSSKIAG